MQKKTVNKDGVDGNRYDVIHVDRHCELIWLMNKRNLFYKPGCVYYEFARKVETINCDKDI